MNELIRDLAVEQGALLVDIEAAFRSEPNLVALYSDNIHPNDRGYAIMAETFFAAITQPASGEGAFQPLDQ
jgi:lysophospholipase L1-like esterase